MNPPFHARVITELADTEQDPKSAFVRRLAKATKEVGELGALLTSYQRSWKERSGARKKMLAN